jgi:hypothetical protein
MADFLAMTNLQPSNYGQEQAQVSYGTKEGESSNVIQLSPRQGQAATGGASMAPGTSIARGAGASTGTATVIGHGAVNALRLLT